MLNIIRAADKEKCDLVISSLQDRMRLDYKKEQASVETILHDIRSNGDSALLTYTEQFDNISLTLDTIRVSDEEIESAYSQVDVKLLEVMRRALKRIQEFHEKQKHNSWFSMPRQGEILGQMVRPLERVGIYVPGGTAAYPSSVLMNAVPAKVAGVNEICMVTPPGSAKTGSAPHPLCIVAAKEAGVTEIYKIGGAQAIAALAFGTQTIAKVDKIVGPGNIYVTLAKRAVFGHTGIDSIAGPSEILIIADTTANPEYVAADLLSQAEHDPLASAILITDSEALAEAVTAEITRQLAALPRRDVVEQSLSAYGHIIVVNDILDAAELSDKIAPEHLELCVNEPFSYLTYIKNAGAVFLGNYSPEPLGDYMAGPNHILPTGGTARFFSPLSVSDFTKSSSVISFTRDALAKLSDDIILFADEEGLTAHANALRVRQ